MAFVLHSATALAQSAEPANMLPLVPPASNAGQQGFVRIINHSDSGGTVRIHAIDDTGQRYGPISLSLDAMQTRHFNSGDLERGNAAKGLPDGVGDGTGNWRLELSADVDFEALAYIRTPDGFVTSMHEVAVEVDEGTNQYRVPFVNPGSNMNQESRLRVVNPGVSSANIGITAVDDAGDAAPLGEVRLTLDAGAARMLSARELEQGGSGLTGRLGDGRGKWRLSVAGNQPLVVMSLLQLPTGHLTNLSRGRDVVVAAPSATYGVGDALPGVPTSGFFIPADRSGASVSTSGGNTTITFNNGGYIELQNGTRYTCRAAGGCQVRNGVVTRGTIVGGSGTPPPPPNAPDLVVQSVSVSDSSPSAGKSFTLRATVRNSGSARSAATTLRYYRSSDATISTSDTAVGTDAVSGLAASGTSAESISLTAPSSAGTYYYGACVDTVSEESNTANNCSSGVRVAVSSGGKAVVATGTPDCVGTKDSFGFVSARIGGTLQARRSVSSVRVEGRANGNFLGIDLVGSMSSGQSKNFSINGRFFDPSATGIRCEIDVSWLERRSQGDGEVRSRSAMDAPLHGLD